MAGELPPNVGEGSTTRPPTEAWAPSFPTKPTPRSGSGRAIGVTALVLAAIAVVLAAVALTVTLGHSTHTASSVYQLRPPLTPPPRQPRRNGNCVTRTSLRRATVRADTNGSDEALARIATTNGAVMLYNAAANPALDPKHRDAARAFSDGIRSRDGDGQQGRCDGSGVARLLLKMSNAKDAAMSKVCGGS